MKTQLSAVLNRQVITLLLLVGSNSYAQPGVPASQQTTEGMQTIASEDDLPGVNFESDIVYANYDEMNVILHLVTPQQVRNAEPVPLVVYVPGSAWFPQNLARSVPRMIDFAEQTGYAVAIVQYRPSTVAKSPAQLVDIKASIRYLRANADRYDIDPERVAIWGTSSGGHMASMVGVTQGIEKFNTADNSEFSSNVSAVVDFFGPTDFQKMSGYPSIMNHDEPTSPESSVIGGPIQDPVNQAKVDEYNPITYVRADREFPPFLIMHGDIDPLVPFNQSLILFEALRDAGHEADFYKLTGAGHGDRFFTPQTYKIVLDFLASHFQ